MALVRARASGDGGWSQSRVRAYAWFLIAQRSGFWPQQYERDLLRAGLSEEQLGAAEAAAEDWLCTCELDGA